MDGLTLKTGDKAYYESSLGFIPCKVLSIRNWQGGAYHVTVKLTASRGEFQTYKRGEIIETHIPHVFPRACLAYRRGIAVIYRFTPIADTGIV